MGVPEDSSTKLPSSKLTHDDDFDLRDDHTGPNQGNKGLEHKFDMKSLERSDKSGVIGRLGEYDLLRVLGSGAMGVVFEALDNRLGRIVAVKVLNRQLATSPTAKRRFLREARAAAAIKHDNVVTIYAVEDFRKCPLLVMELVEGESLRELIRRRGTLLPTEVLKLAAEISAGLAAAHAQGVIHRDIKPANILIENSLFRAKLSDFGLARAAFDNVELTGAGLVVGTPAYMAPEQVLGAEIDPRADLFSFGCVMYAMLCGHSPFHGSNHYEVSRNVTDFRPKPLNELDPKIPRFLSDLVNKLLEKSPDNRPQSAAEVSQVLTRHLVQLNQTPSDRIDRVLHDEPTDVWQSGKKSYRKVFAYIAMVSLVAVFSAVLYWRPWQPSILLVAADGSAQFSKISVAIESARPGTTIRIIQPGLYPDELILDKPRHERISIVGMSGVRIVSGPERRSVLQIDNVDGVTISGLHIETASKQFGIELSGRCAGTTIESCTIKQPENSERAAVYLHQGASGTQLKPIELSGLEILYGSVGLVLGEEHPTANGVPVENISVSNCRIHGAAPGVGVAFALLNEMKSVEINRNSVTNGITAISLVFPEAGEFENVDIHDNGIVGFTNFLYAVDATQQNGLRISKNSIADTTNLMRLDRVRKNSTESNAIEQLPNGICDNKWKADREVSSLDLGKIAEVVSSIAPENLDPALLK